MRRTADGEDVLVRGTIVGYPESDEILLQDTTGIITVDLEARHERMWLRMGTQILVLGELDRDGGIEIEADHIFVARGPVASHPTLALRSLADVYACAEDQVVVVRGRVRSFPENDEIIIADASGSMLVDLDDDHHLRLGLRLGDELIILAEVDNDIGGRRELDALVIRQHVAVRPVVAAVGKPAVVEVVAVRPAPTTPPAPAVTSTPPASAAKESIKGRLAALKSLVDEGLITAEEYATRKVEILAEL
ncbi:MAG: hypothetical protein CMJ83_08045 [Planctomycetes bacterium]|nr:hypothetical protein [Planctomycetota bacterium]